MHKYEKEIIKLEIAKGTPCDLSHKGMDSKEFHRAIDVIQQDIGYYNQRQYSVTIFVCQDCVNRLYSPNFILLYCLKCNHSQWIVKPYAKMNYGQKHICWMSCCPDCAEHGEKATIFWTD